MHAKSHTIHNTSPTRISENFPLHKATVEGNIEAVSHYCKSIKTEDTSLIDCFNEFGDTPLIYAIHKKNEDIIDILLQSGANPNQSNLEGNTPLIAAVKDFSSNIVIRLLEEGAKINQTNAYNESPLKIATTLGNQECINLLTEHGASFTRNQHNISATPAINSTSEYISSITKLIKGLQKDKKTPKTLQSFCETAFLITGTYLGKKTQENRNYQSLLKVLDQICEMSKKEILEKDILNLTRKTLVAINSEIKATLLKEGDTGSIHLLSKAETTVEEEITKLKHNEHQTVNHHNTNVAQSSDVRHSHENHSYEKGEKTQNSQEMLDITQGKVLCRMTNHDVVLTTTTTIKPHHPRTSKEASTLLSLAKKRLTYEINLLKTNQDSISAHIAEIETIIKLSKKEDRNLTSNEGHFIDQLLRPGKTKRMHIIHFPSAHTTSTPKELSLEALETGTTIHYFDYHQSAETKNDLILTGIANINKLLDDGIHPDKIILQGEGPEAYIVRDTAQQFAKRGVYLTQFYLNSDAISTANHKQLSLTDTLKAAQDCPESMKHFISEFTKLIKAGNKTNATEYSFLSSTEKNSLALAQLANLCIRKIQMLLCDESKYRNAALPKERVECIIGVTDIDENDLDD